MINGRGGVSPTTARRIQEAIDRLGYQPRPVHARPGRKPAAAGVRTGNVCLLLVGASRGLLERPGIHTLVTSIEETLRGHGLNLLLAQAPHLDTLPPAITGRKADGVLLIGEAVGEMPKRHRRLPAVWVLSSRARPHRWADHVQPDNEQVGLLALEHLVRQGHRRVAFFNDQPEHPGFVQRGQSFESRAALQGVDFVTFRTALPTEDDGAVWGFGETRRSTLELVDQLLKTSPRPTGLFVPSDEQATRLYLALQERNIRPGREMAVVSCDNQDAWLRQLEPRPVSIDLNFALIGSRAVDQLMLRISHPEEPPGTRVLIPPQLVDRGQADSDRAVAATGAQMVLDEDRR